MSIDSTKYLTNVFKSPLLWGVAGGALLFGGATLAAFLGGRYLPANMGRDLAQHAFKFLTTPMTGSLTALGLVGGGALVGGKVHLTRRKQYRRYLKIDSMGLNEDETLAMVRYAKEAWGRGAARVLIQEAIFESGRVDAESAEKVEPAIVEGVLALLPEEPATFSSTLKQKILAHKGIEVDETVAGQLTEQQTELVVGELTKERCSTLVSDPDAVRDGAISMDSGLACKDGWNHAVDWNKAIVLLHRAIHKAKQG